MLTFAGAAFVYYTVWAILLVSVTVRNPMTIETNNFYSLSSIRRAQFTAGFPHASGQSEFRRSSWFWAYPPLDSSWVARPSKGTRQPHGALSAAPIMSERRIEPSIEMMYSGTQGSSTTTE